MKERGPFAGLHITNLVKSGEGNPDLLVLNLSLLSLGLYFKVDIRVLLTLLLFVI